MHNIDLFVQNYFSLTRTSTLTEVMYIFTNFFDITAYSVAAFLFVTLFIYLLRGVRFAGLFVVSVATSSLIVYLLKNIFAVARPTDAVMTTFGQSFPSFHATISTVFFILLMYIFDGEFSFFVRMLFNTFCILMIFMFAFSRVYLGVHWFSDVFFGILLGAFLSYSFIVIFRHVMNVRDRTSMVK